MNGARAETAVPGSVDPRASGDANLRALRAASGYGAAGVALLTAPFAIVFAVFGSGGRISMGGFVVLLFASDFMAAAVGCTGLYVVAAATVPRAHAFWAGGAIAAVVVPAATVLILGRSWWSFYLVFFPCGLVSGIHLGAFGPLLRLRARLPSALQIGALAGTVGPLVITWASLGSFEPESAMPAGFVLSAMGWTFDVAILVWSSTRIRGISTGRLKGDLLHR